MQAPSMTTPGSYPGSLQIGWLAVPIVAEAEPSPRVCEPSRLVLDVKPRATLTTDLRLLNTGNVPCVVPMTSTFCLFDGHGIDHAIWVALMLSRSSTRRSSRTSAIWRRSLFPACPAQACRSAYAGESGIRPQQITRARPRSPAKNAHDLAAMSRTRADAEATETVLRNSERNGQLLADCAQPLKQCPDMLLPAANHER